MILGHIVEGRFSNLSASVVPYFNTGCNTDDKASKYVTFGSAFFDFIISVQNYAPVLSSCCWKFNCGAITML